ncbi:hypothetical protein WA158_004933 [Blastocystis sp. Blastoise]
MDQMFYSDLSRLQTDLSTFSHSVQEIACCLISSWSLGVSHVNVSLQLIDRSVKSMMSYCNGDFDKESYCSVSSQSSHNSSVSSHSSTSSNQEDDVDTFTFRNSSCYYYVKHHCLSDYPGSYIYDLSQCNVRSPDGSIYVDFDDTYAPVIFDYLQGKKIDFSEYSNDEQYELVNVFVSFGLPVPESLVCLTKIMERQVRKYQKGKALDLTINGKHDSLIYNYLYKNNLLEELIKRENHSFLPYDYYQEKFYLNKTIKHTEYIHEYIENNTITIPKEIQKTFDYNSLFSDLEMFGRVIYSSIKDKLFPVIKDSVILNQYYADILASWLGKYKQWKLLYRGSRDGYSASSFHSHCDYHGETVVIVRQVNKKMGINIFGGYTSQSWNCTDSFCYDSEAFLFTLINEHQIAPSRYNIADPEKAIYNSASFGPIFGAGGCIAIYDECNKNSLSYCTSNSYSVKETPQRSSLFVNTAGKDSRNTFIVDDIEVYGLC